MSNASFDLKSFLHNKKEPILLSNILKWDILKWSLEDWKNLLDNEKLEFRTGVNQPTDKPQWERNTTLLEKNFLYFLNHIENNKNEWLYFDYKHLNSWFKNIEQLREKIDWSPIGFPEIKPKDCTIWIGSKGAHTPCHLDCYGFNLVYQVYGKKLWLLFPPEENLLPTRIPYEESSVYSKLNFFSPKLTSFAGVSKCRKVELNPGDILFVPHKWWHYVENLDTSISINVWLPMAEDHKERLKESIVQYFAKQVNDVSDKGVNRTILNPNMDDLILESCPKSLIDTLNKCKHICQDNLSSKRVYTIKQSEENEEPEKVINKPDGYITTIPVLSKDEFLNVLHQQIDRFKGYKTKEETADELDDNIEFFQALTNPEVIDLITNILLKNKS